MSVRQKDWFVIIWQFGFLCWNRFSAKEQIYYNNNDFNIKNANCRLLTEPPASTLMTHKTKNARLEKSVFCRIISRCWLCVKVKFNACLVITFKNSTIDEESNGKECQNKEKNQKEQHEKTMKWNYLTQIFGVDVMISERACDGFKKL